MRKHALLYVAKTKYSGAIIKYVLGKEIFRKSNDEHDQMLSWISGINALDDLFDGSKRIFYVSGLAVRREFRRCGIAERLSLALNADLRLGNCFASRPDSRFPSPSLLPLERALRSSIKNWDQYVGFAKNH